MEQSEVIKLQEYLRTTFATDKIVVKARKEAEDSVEVLIDEEFTGLIYKDDDEGEVSYNFNMAILDMDLSKTA